MRHPVQKEKDSQGKKQRVRVCVRGGGSGEGGNTDPPFPNLSLRFIIVVSWQRLVAKVVDRCRVTNLTGTLPHNPPHGELRLTGLSASGVSSARWASSCLGSCVSPTWPMTFVTGTLGQPVGGRRRGSPTWTA